MPLGGRATIRDSSGVPPPPPERDETEAAVVPARRALGEAAWAAAFAVGRAMTLEEAMAEALHVSPRSATPPHAEFTEIANRGR